MDIVRSIMPEPIAIRIHELTRCVGAGDELAPCSLQPDRAIARGVRTEHGYVRHREYSVGPSLDRVA
jgi:hypothetical protein